MQNDKPLIVKSASSDFFDAHEGTARDFMKSPLAACARDLTLDGILTFDSRMAVIRRAADALAPQKVLVVGVEVPSRGGALQRICNELAASRHSVVASTVMMQPKGKFENIDDAIAKAPAPLNDFDWLIITDDDVKLPARFTDRYLAVASLTDLTVSQPAHRFLSYTTYELTRRHRGGIARQTSFVEIGPLTVLRRECFDELIPFPPSRWAYGIDVLWAAICKSKGWRMGVIDAVPMRHLRPVGASYNMDEAREEGRELLMRSGVQLRRSNIMQHGEELFQKGAFQDL